MSFYVSSFHSVLLCLLALTGNKQSENLMVEVGKYNNICCLFESLYFSISKYYQNVNKIKPGM